MRFTNLPEFPQYRSFRIDSREGNHTVCKVLLSIDPENAESFLSLSEQRKKVEVSSDSGDRVMDGIISAVDVKFDVTSTTAEVTLSSESLLLEEKGKERIFQNPQKTYSDILKSFESVDIGKCDHINDVVEEIVVQHNIDDFSFLVYLAHKCGTGLWITEDGKATFGEINNKKSFSDTETEHRKAILEKRISAQNGGRKIEILTMEHIPNGSVLIHNQHEYIICEVTVLEDFDEIYFKYVGYTEPKFNEEIYAPKQLITIAKVTDNKDPDNLGRIKVDFIDFEDKDTEKIWISYLTPFVGSNNGGSVFIPDIGDEVIVCISDGKVYALNSLRINELPDNCKEVDIKCFAVKDLLISISDTEISVKQGDKSVIKMNSDSINIEHDKSGLIVDGSMVSSSVDKSEFVLKSDSIKSEVGNSVIKLTSDEISSENGKGNISVKNGVTVLSGGGSGLALNNGKTKLSGNNIDLSTQGVSF